MKLEELELDQWVFDTSCQEVFQVLRIRKPEDMADVKYPYAQLVLQNIYGRTRWFLMNQELTIRPATPNEIQAKQKEAKWKAIQRKVGEFRVGDVVCQRDGVPQTFFVIQHEQQIEVMKIMGRKYRLVCPVEKRIDLDE